MGEPPTLAPPPTGPTGLCGCSCWVQGLEPQRCATFPGGACVFPRTKRGQVNCCCKGSLKCCAIPFKPSLALCLVVVWHPGAKAPGRGVQPAVTSVWGHQALVPVTPGAVWWFWFLSSPLPTTRCVWVCACSDGRVVPLSPSGDAVAGGRGVLGSCWVQVWSKHTPSQGRVGCAHTRHTGRSNHGQIMCGDGRTAATAMQALLGHPGAGSCSAARAGR